MINAVIPQVDPINDRWDYLTVGVGIATMIFSMLAIGYAAVAQRAAANAHRDAVKERRHLFELEVLRELIRDLDENPHLHADALFNPGGLRRYRLRLDLPTSHDPRSLLCPHRRFE